jgi:PleD family two-component response regulator
MSTDNSLLDQLTGLINRKGFEEKLKAAVLHAQQTDRPLSLAFLDIDFFKRLNDGIGHEAGDVVIKAIGDIVQRVAGDAEIDQLKSLSDGKKEVNAQLTISGGIAAFPIDAQDENELLRKADQALYKAKNSGRNKVVLSYEEKMAPKTSHYTLTQLERLSELAKEQGVGEAVLLREALDNLLIKYKHAFASRK